MKILITGENGYISSKLKMYLNNFFDEIIQISVKKNKFDQIDFSGVSVVIHTAAIVHKKEAVGDEEKYYKANTELTENLAIQAKEAGVKQFIFLSTMAVYGNVQGPITKHDQTKPVTLYGKSKLAAEKKLLELKNEHFKISIVRPPMIYGPKCPGNYAMLSKISRKLLIFPNVENKRSMLFIDNLCEFIFQLIQNEDSGTFHPQDPQYITTSIMVKEIAKANKKSIYLSKLAGMVLKMLIGNKEIYRKVFGDLYYDESLSIYSDNSYQKFNLQQSVKMTEREQ